MHLQQNPPTTKMKMLWFTFTDNIISDVQLEIKLKFIF